MTTTEQTMKQAGPGWLTWCGLAIVAAAAAVLSFDALMTLAELCGTPGELSWLLPVCIDAAALVATRVWLADTSTPEAKRFAKGAALAMIALSVAGNGVSHWMIADQIKPEWWAVVAVASVPPAVLGTIAHLASLVGKRRQPVRQAHQVEDQAHQVGDQPVRQAHQVEDQAHQVGDLVAELSDAGGELAETGEDAGPVDLVERARQVMADAAEQGRPMGRGRLARALGVTEHQARQLMDQVAAQPSPALAVAS